jgi:hypothetical protein
MKILVLLLAVMSLSGCGRNPQLVKKEAKLDDILTPPLVPMGVSPSLILREKGTKKEDLMDFGELKTGEKISKVFELQNVGSAKAIDISIPTSAGPFKITNVNCEKDLDIKEVCELSGELSSEVENVMSSELQIPFKDPTGRVLKAKTVLLGNVRNPVVVKEGQPRLVLLVKNSDAGNLVLKDIPLGEAAQVQLELRNVGDGVAKDISLPSIPAPFKLKSHNCPTQLAIDAACDLLVEYVPTEAKRDEIQIKITFNFGVIIQVIVANAVRLDQPSQLEVVDGLITQDIYELLNVKPETLSQFQDVRGIDLGSLVLNKETNFKINLNNIGEYPANISKVKGFQTDLFSLNGGSFPGQSGTCSLSINKGKCSLDVKVVPSKLGNIHDLIEFTYLDGRGNTRRLSLLVMANVKEGDPSVTCKTLAARNSIDQSGLLDSLTAAGAYKLPYKLKAPKSTAALKLLFNTDSNQNLRMTKNHISLVVPSNHNTMVQFGFDLSGVDLSKIKNYKLELDILKISTEGVKFDTTEVLCLNESRRCSGTFFIDSNYRKLNTTNYVLHSNLFSSELLRSSQQDISSLAQMLAQRGNLSAQGAAGATDNLFRLKKTFILSSLFGHIQGANLTHGLNFVLADDAVLLSAPRLILESDAEACSVK